MAIDLTVQYPGKIGPATGPYPYGEPRNVTVPDDGTGTPWEAAIAKETEGFKQALLSAASIVPSGTPDAVGVSQYLQAVVEQASGRSFMYDATGTVDAIVLTQQANQEPVQSYFDNLTVEFLATGNNTGVVTVNVNGLGVVPVLNSSGGILLADQILNGERYKLIYDLNLLAFVFPFRYYTLDTPISLLSTVAIAAVNTAISNVTLDNVKAKIANVHGHLRVETVTAAIGNIDIEIYVASSNKAISGNPLYSVLHSRAAKDTTSSVRFFDFDSNDFDVNLDSGFDFWYTAVIANVLGGPEELDLVLKGYWA